MFIFFLIIFSMFFFFRKRISNNRKKVVTTTTTKNAKNTYFDGNNCIHTIKTIHISFYFGWNNSDIIITNRKWLLWRWAWQWVGSKNHWIEVKYHFRKKKLFKFQLAHLSESECQRFSNNECGKLYCNASFHLLNSGQFFLQRKKNPLYRKSIVYLFLLI